MDHEALVELFRSRDALLHELVGDRFAIRGLRSQSVSPVLTQMPTSYRADCITVFRDADDVAQLAVVIEIQRSKDSFKQYSWPIYVAATRREYECSTLLVVVALEPEIASWARASIDLGHPGFVLSPIVISHEQVPSLINKNLARRLPELAVLSALAHGSAAIARIALPAPGLHRRSCGGRAPQV